MSVPKRSHEQNGNARGLGERLKALRHELGLTLSGVSERTGVSISNLSKIERAEVSPSFDVIIRVAEGLQVPLEHFVMPGPKTGVTGRKTTTRRAQGVPFSSDQYDYLAHAGELQRKAMVPLEMWVRARSADEFEHWSEHDGEEFVYVIEGEIEIHTEHYAPFRLKAGESTYFDSSMRHVYVSAGQGDAHLLSVSHSPAAGGAARLEGFLNPAVRPAPRRKRPRRDDAGTD